MDKCGNCGAIIRHAPDCPLDEIVSLKMALDGMTKACDHYQMQSVLRGQELKRVQGKLFEAKVLLQRVQLIGAPLDAMLLDSIAALFKETGPVA